MVRRRRARLSAFQKMLQCPRAACVWQALLYATDVHVPIVLSARQGRFPRRLNRFLPEIGSIRFPLSSYSLFSRRCGHFSGGKFGVCIRARRQRSLQIELLCRLPRANLLLFLDFIAFASSRSLSVFPDSGYAALRQASRPSVLLTPASVRAFLVEGFNLLQYSSIGCDSIRVALRFSLPYIVFAIRALRGRLYCCARQVPSGALGRMCPPTL